MKSFFSGSFPVGCVSFLLLFKLSVKWKFASQFPVDKCMINNFHRKISIQSPKHTEPNTIETNRETDQTVKKTPNSSRIR